MEPSSPSFLLISSSSDVVDNTAMPNAGLNGGDDTESLISAHTSSSLPKQTMLPYGPRSDSSSPPNSPSAFAFSPTTNDDDNFYPSSYDTDLTSFIGSWEPSPSFGSGSSPSKCKGKQRAAMEDLVPDHYDSEFTSHYRDKGKSVDRSQSLSSGSHFEFDFEFEQDNNNSKDRVHSATETTPPLSGADDSYSRIGNNPISLSPSYSSIPSSPNLQSFNPEMSHKHSISSLSLKSLRSSSSRSFDRIRRSFLRKDSKFNDNKHPNSLFKSNSSSPSTRLLSFSSRSSSASSLKKGIRKVFGRNGSKRRGTFDNLLDNDNVVGDGNEDGSEDFEPLDQSILSDTTISPRIQTGETTKRFEMNFDPDPTEDSSAEDESVFGAMAEGIETLRSFTPRDLFAQLLPRELQLRILKGVVSSYEDEYHEMSISNSTLPWTAKIAESTRWVGREKGIRELLRLATVSKLWHSLVFDGELWVCLRFSPYVGPVGVNRAETLSSQLNQLSPSLLLKLAKRAGPFIRVLDLKGWSHLDNISFRAISAALTKTGEVPNADGVRPTLSSDSFSCSPSSPSLSATKDLYAETNLTHLVLRTCIGLTMHSVHYILLRSPLLQALDLHGLGADVVNNSTCELLNAFCPVLKKLDIGRCFGISGTGLEKLVQGSGTEGENSIRNVHVEARSLLKILFASGICDIDPDVMFTLARFAPFLEVLDLSYSDITDEAIGAFVWWDENSDEEDEVYRRVEVTSRQMASLSSSARFAFIPTFIGTYFKRVTSLRHLNLSFTHISENACIFLCHSVPKLECIELAGIGAALGEEGLVKLFETTPFIRRIDLEDASGVSDAVLRALTPSVNSCVSELSTPAPKPLSSMTPQPGHMLEHITLSYAQNISNNAFLLLIRSCTRLTTLEVDNTRISCAVLKSFVETMRTRGTRDAKVAVMDCRTVTESFVNELLEAGTIRPRLGYRAFEARAIGGFLDGRDREASGSSSCESPSSALGDPGRVGIDECDDTRVTLKSFWSWQALDTAKEAERKRNGTGNSESGKRSPGLGFGTGPGSLSRPRWLSTWARYLI